MKEGIVKELRARQYYQKPSEIKREKKKEGIKNYKKKIAKLQRELQSFHACALHNDINSDTGNS